MRKKHLPKHPKIIRILSNKNQTLIFYFLILIKMAERHEKHTDLGHGDAWKKTPHASPEAAELAFFVGTCRKVEQAIAEGKN